MISGVVHEYLGAATALGDSIKIYVIEENSEIYYYFTDSVGFERHEAIWKKEDTPPIVLDLVQILKKYSRLIEYPDKKVLVGPHLARLATSKEHTSEYVILTSPPETELDKISVSLVSNSKINWSWYIDIVKEIMKK